MAIALRAAAAWVAGSTSVVTVLPAGIADGDMMLLFVGCKPFNAVVVTPAGWSPVAGTGGSNGSTASGVDTGSVLWAVFQREFKTGATAPTVTVTSGNVALGFIIGFSKAAAKAWDVAGAKGSDATSGTSLALTMDAAVGVASGDMLVSAAVIPGDNSIMGSPTITASGATVGAVTVAPGTAGSTQTGNDLGSSSAYAPVTAGASSAAPVVTWPLGTATTGGGAIVRLREIDYVPPDLTWSRPHRPRQAVARAGGR